MGVVANRGFDTVWLLSKGRRGSVCLRVVEGWAIVRVGRATYTHVY